MITITLVRQATRFVGLTHSDRWNLDQLILDFPGMSRLLTEIPAGTCSKVATDRFRRILAVLGFRLVISRGVNIRALPTPDEIMAFRTPARFILASAVA